MTLCNKLTRLISIVSKPIIIVVVVVVIDVVFVKKKLGPKISRSKIFDPKKFWVQKSLGTKMLPKKIR